MFTQPEINETLRMIRKENLDIRTITLGITLRDCISPGAEAASRKIYDKVCRKAERLVPVADELELEFGVPIINKRVSVTPVSLVAEASDADSYLSFAQTLDKAAETVGIDFLGGFSALVQKGSTEGDRRLIESIPRSLTETGRVCSSVNVASTRAGINMDAIEHMGEIITKTSQIDPQGCAKLVVFSNAPEDNPFMAGAFHGVGEGDCAINVGVSGPGVIKAAIEDVRGASFDQLSETIKKTAFKITRMGGLVAREAASRLGYNFGIVDLSLAPTPTIGDSVARILEEMGLETAGAPGSTAAVALLNDAVKKGGIMASSHVGGLSGAFLPVSEDEGMAEAVRKGSLSLAKLEAMTAVCSVGLDMVAVPGDTTAQTISAVIADEIAIGVVNKKTTAVRIIPVPGKTAGEWVEFGGLLGRAPVMEVSRDSSSDFIARGGRIPAPLTSYVN